MFQLIACKKWDNSITTMIYLLYELIGVSPGSFTNHKGWQDLRYRIKTHPDPGITIMSENSL